MNARARYLVLGSVAAAFVALAALMTATALGIHPTGASRDRPNAQAEPRRMVTPQAAPGGRRSRLRGAPHVTVHVVSRPTPDAPVVAGSAPTPLSPIAGATLQLHGPRGDVLVLTADRLGTANMPADTHAPVLVSSKGYYPEKILLTDSPVVFVGLLPKPTVRGQVVNIPVTVGTGDLMVYCLPGDLKRAMAKVGGTFDPRSIKVASNGTFSFVPSEPTTSRVILTVFGEEVDAVEWSYGSSWVELDAAGYGPEERGTVRLAVGYPLEFLRELERRAAYGFADERTGLMLLRLEHVQSHEVVNMSAEIDQALEATYVLQEARFGRYRGSVTIFGNRYELPLVDLHSGRLVRVDLPAFGALRCSITGYEGVPDIRTNYVRADIVSPAGQRFGVATFWGTGGCAEQRLLPPGRYSVWGRWRNRASRPRIVAIRANETAEVNLVLEDGVTFELVVPLDAGEEILDIRVVDPGTGAALGVDPGRLRSHRVRPQAWQWRRRRLTLAAGSWMAEVRTSASHRKRRFDLAGETTRVVVQRP